jgi:putative transposase
MQLVLKTKSHWREEPDEVKVSRPVLKPSQNGDISGLGQPTSEQEILLAKSFGCARWFWNYALNLCQETYKDTGKGLSRGYIQGLLPALKKEYEWLKDPYSQCLQVVALNLSTAYKNFFEKRAMLPKFKSKHGRQSISYPQNVKFDGDYINLPKIGLVHCQLHRSFDGTIAV